MINSNYQLKGGNMPMKRGMRAPKMNVRPGMTNPIAKAVTRTLPAGPQVRGTRSTLVAGPQTKATRNNLVGNMTKMNNMSKKIMKNLPQKAFSMARKMK